MAQAQAYTYTDLSVILRIDPEFCTGMIYASFASTSGDGKIKKTVTDYNPHTGDVLVLLTQAETKKLRGIVTVQLNGFLNGQRWGSQQVYFTSDDNLLEEVLT